MDEEQDVVQETEIADGGIMETDPAAGEDELLRMRKIIGQVKPVCYVQVFRIC